MILGRDLTFSPSPKESHIAVSKKRAKCLTVSPLSRILPDNFTPFRISSKTVSASGSGTREARCESYQARSYLWIYELQARFWKSLSLLVRHWGPIALCQRRVSVQKEMTYLVGLLQRSKFTCCSFNVCMILIRMMDQSQTSKRTLL